MEEEITTNIQSIQFMREIENNDLIPTVGVGIGHL